MKISSASFYLFLVLILLSSCEKEEDGDPSTSSTDSSGAQTFTVDFENRYEPFVGLITRYTCGACGQHGHPNFDQLLAEQSQVNGAAFKYLPADALHTEESIAVYEHYPVTGTPTFFLNATGYGSSISEWKTAALAAMSTDPPLQIAMHGTLTAPNVYNIEVKIVMDPTMENKLMRLAVYAIESNIVSPQTDYSRNPSLVENYIHNHVFRGAPTTGVFGTALNYSADTVSTEHVVGLSEEVNDDHVCFTAVVWEVDGNGNPVGVLNSQSVREE